MKEIVSFSKPFSANHIVPNWFGITEYGIILSSSATTLHFKTHLPTKITNEYICNF